MPNKGEKGLTPAQHKEKGEQLTKKLETFAEKPNANNAEHVTPAKMKDMISKEFSRAELNVIWKRITSILNNEQVTLKEAWGTMKTLGKKRAAEE